MAESGNNVEEDDDDADFQLSTPFLPYLHNANTNRYGFNSLNSLMPNERGAISIFPSTTTTYTASTSNHGIPTSMHHMAETDGANSEPYLSLTSLDTTRLRQDKTQSQYLPAFDKPKNIKSPLQSRPELDQGEEVGNSFTSMSWARTDQTATERHGGQPRGSIEENSPLGSPRQKYEELVPNSPYDPSKARYNDRRYTRIDANNRETETGRLNTFYDWPNDLVDKRELAKAGFYYKGVGDEAWCFRCECMIRNWQGGDDPKKEHRELCGFDCV